MIDWRDGATATSRNDGNEAADAAGAAGAPGAVLGSRGHVRATLIRARAAIASSRARTRTSGTVLARAGALVGTSAELVQVSVAIRAELRASITAYVRHLHADGLPAERMLVLVKTAVRDATPPEIDPVEARDLMEDVVRWSIEAYYHAA